MTNKLVLLAIAAMALCGGCGKSREQLSADALDLKDADRRREGIVELSRHKWGLEGRYPQAYSYLAADPEPSVRCAAIGALAKVGDARYLPVLIKALDDPDSKVRTAAADAMDAAGGPNAIEPLCRAAGDDPEPMVRARCARDLRHYKQKRVLEALIACLDDEDFGVRSAARGSLCALTGEDAAYEADQWSRLLAQKQDPFRPPPPAKRPWWKR